MCSHHFQVTPLIEHNFILHTDVHPGSPLWLAWLFDQVEMPGEEKSLLASRSFLSVDQESNPLSPSSWAISWQSGETPEMPDLEAEFPAMAGPYLGLSERYRIEDPPWIIRKRPSHRLGCHVILSSSRILARTNFFIIKNDMFSRHTGQFLLICYLSVSIIMNPLCLASW